MNWRHPSCYCVFPKAPTAESGTIGGILGTRPMQHTSDWLLISILRCIYQNNGNHTRAVFASCFILESCKHRVGKIRTLLRQSGSAESLKLQRALLAMEGSAHPVYQTLIFWGSGSETSSLVPRPSWHETILWSGTIRKSVRVVDKKCGGYFTKWNRTQLRSKIWNGTDLMEHSFLSCIAQKKVADH